MSEQKETLELTKLTATKLREIAMEYPEIQGAHAMKKEELIAAICKARGESIPSLKKEKVKKGQKERDIRKIKQEIRALKAEKAKALETKNNSLLKKLRQRIKKLKRESRKAGASG